MNEETLLPFRGSISLLMCELANEELEEELARDSRMGRISSIRCRADLRDRTSGEGSGARVDWCNCLARMREWSEEVRDAGSTLAVTEVDGELKSEMDVGLRECFWALTAPAFRSVRRVWPFCRRGEALEVEGVDFSGARGSLEMNAIGLVHCWSNARWSSQRVVRFLENLCRSVSTWIGRL